MNVRESYSRALEQGTLSLLRIVRKSFRPVGFRARGSNLTTSLNGSAKGLFGAHWAEWPLILRMGKWGCCRVQDVVGMMLMFPNHCQWKLAVFFAFDSSIDEDAGWWSIHYLERIYINTLIARATEASPTKKDKNDYVISWWDMNIISEKNYRFLHL